MGAYPDHAPHLFSRAAQPALDPSTGPLRCRGGWVLWRMGPGYGLRPFRESRGWDSFAGLPLAW